MAFAAITVAQDSSFNDWADGLTATAPVEMSTPGITGLSALSASLDGFNHMPAAPAPGSFMDNINHQVANFGAEFAARNELSVNPWMPEKAAVKPVSMFDSIDALGRSGLDSLSGPGDSIEMGSMFGRLAEPKAADPAEPKASEEGLTAFQRRKYDGNNLS